MNFPAKGGYLFPRDFLGCLLPLKHLLMTATGLFTYPGFSLLNHLDLEGTANLVGLPDRQVLFVSNHQTYFADVIALFHVFAAVKWGFGDSLRNPVYLLNPKVNAYYVAAEETMRAGLLPRILAYAGSVSIKRTWREAGHDVQRQVKLTDYALIGKALESGWVVTFPQGTTTPYAKGRRGTCHVIKHYQPTVIPVVIDGFRETFNKKGLRLRKLGARLSVRIKPPLTFDETDDANTMLHRIMVAIEQIPPEECRQRV
jgi:1-acyl-sn-glycerol-3-phosphate acyltransferase